MRREQAGVLCIQMWHCVSFRTYPGARLCIVVMRNHCDHAPLCAKAGNQYIIVFTKPKNFAIRWRTPPPSSNGIFFRHGVENIPVLVVKKVNGKRNPPSPPPSLPYWQKSFVCFFVNTSFQSNFCTYKDTYCKDQYWSLNSW